MNGRRQILDRHARRRVDEALMDTPVVVIQGARQVGKSTLAATIAQTSQQATLLTLDDEPVRRAARADPAGFIEGVNGLVVIDEIQRVPELILAIKARVDRDRRAGSFLLTGSANLVRLRSIHDSLAGRAETVELFGFSQGELTGQCDDFVDRVFGDVLPVSWRSEFTRHDYLERACSGGYPEAVDRTQRRRGAWFESYTSRIVERDAADVSGLQRLGDLGRLLRLCAARNASELNLADLAADAGFPARTLSPYLDLLETLYLTWRVPAWSTNLTSRVVGRPKMVLLDSGLAAHLMHITPDSLEPTRHPEPAGPLLESFVVNELRKQAAWGEAPVRIYHYRDRSGPEVDIVLEHADGRVVAIEVKATSSLGASSMKWLTHLRDRLGERFVQGVVLYTGATALPMGERLTAQPIVSLWQ